MLLTLLLWIVLAIVAFGLRQPWSPRRVVTAAIGGLLAGAVFAYFNMYAGSVRGILALVAIALVVSGASFLRRWHSTTRPLSRWMPTAGVAIILLLLLAGLFPLTSWGAKSVNERIYNDLESNVVKQNAPPLDRALDVRVVPWDLASQLLARGYGADASWLDLQPDRLQAHTYPDTVNGQFIWVHAPVPETSKWLVGGRLADKVLYVKNNATDLTPRAVSGVVNVQIDGAWWQHRVARYAEDKGELRYVLQDVTLQLDDSYHPFWIAYLATLDLRSQPHLAKVLVVDANSGAENEYAPQDAPAWIEQVYPESYVYEWAQYWGLHREGLLYRWFNAAGLVEPDDVTVRYIRVENQTYWLLPMKQLSSANLGGYILVNTRTGAATFYDRFEKQLVDYDTAYTQLQAIMASGEATKGAGQIRLAVSEGYIYPIRMADGTVRDAYVFPLQAGYEVARFAVIDAQDYNNRRVFSDTIESAIDSFSRLTTPNATIVVPPVGSAVVHSRCKLQDGTIYGDEAVIGCASENSTVSIERFSHINRTILVQFGDRKDPHEWDELAIAISRLQRGETANATIDVGTIQDIESGSPTTTVVDITLGGGLWADGPRSPSPGFG